MDRDLGALEPGKLADFVVLDRNPLADIRDSESVRYTVINGRVYDAWTMDEVGGRPRKRRPFYFERTETMGTLEQLVTEAQRCPACSPR